MGISRLVAYPPFPMFMRFFDFCSILRSKRYTVSTAPENGPANPYLRGFFGGKS